MGAVLLSYARQGNIDPILRALLRGTLVERVVLSNNNPECSTGDFVSVTDRRLTIIDQPERQGSGLRWHLAHEMLGDLDVVVAIDDDLFLYPRQIEHLVAHAIAAPTSPHGVVGSFDRRPVERVDSPVDILWRAYVATTEHVRRYGEILADLDQATVDQVDRWADDIVISSTGVHRPQVHDVGRLLSSPSSSDPDVSLHHQPGFVASRRQVQADVEAVRSTRDWGAPTP